MVFGPRGRYYGALLGEQLVPSFHLANGLRGWHCRAVSTGAVDRRHLASHCPEVRAQLPAVMDRVPHHQ